MTLDDAFDAMRNDEKVLFVDGLENKRTGTISGIEKDYFDTYKVLDDEDNSYTLDNVFSTRLEDYYTLKVEIINIHRRVSEDDINKLIEEILNDTKIDYGDLKILTKS